MKYILTFICCLMMSTAFAETIGNVEYQLPQIAKDWNISNKLEFNGTTIIYTPKISEGQNTREFFGVNSNKLSSNFSDINTVKAFLTKFLPAMDIHVTELEKNDNGILYEWFANDKGLEKVHGWGRILSSNEGTVILTYQTENISDLAKARAIWLPVLKGAHLTSH